MRNDQVTHSRPDGGQQRIAHPTQTKTWAHPERVALEGRAWLPEGAPLPGARGGLSRQRLLTYVGKLEAALSETEHRMRELAEASVAAQEEERQRVAFEVHDRVAQTLASAFQQLQRLESLTEDRPEVRQVAVRASVLLREAIRESRSIMNDLHPPVLEEFGVASLIEEELQRFREETGCRTSFEADYSPRPPRSVEVVLYRIFHEALINIRRHALGATNVTVCLTSNGQSASLRVQDDGPGFDVTGATQATRVGGLMSMRRRAEVAGGSFEIVSAPGQGAQVTMRVPFIGGV